MKTNSRSWQPTLTLARLFEEQNQFYDALAAYELISQNDPSPELRERIEDLHLRILNDPNRNYDPRLEQLFSPEELAYLKILDHQGFSNMAKAREKLREEMQGSELIFSEVMPEEVLVDESELDALREILEEIEQQAQISLISETSDVGECNVQDFLIAMLVKFDKDQKLSEVKLSDLLSLFLEMQSLKNQP
ncbi:MAG TPA: hypothetical protein PLJ90_00915 [Candidatus Cloacimonas sp.]|nr:hypothetical protein [Candidatus Cloacimonas sp.]